MTEQVTPVETQVSSVEETNAAPTTEVETTQTETETAAPASVEATETSEKPRRSERRIQQLLSKLQDKGGTQPQAHTASDVMGQSNLPPWWTPQTPTVTQNEDGTIPYEQVQADIDRRVELKLAYKEQQDKFKQTVQTHASDLETVMKNPEFSNSKFDEKFTKLYNAANYDAFGNFAPKLSPSELYESLKDSIELGKTQGASEASVKMATSISQQAVAPTAGSTDAKTEKQKLFNQARQTGSVESWAEYLKRVAPTPK